MEHRLLAGRLQRGRRRRGRGWPGTGRARQRRRRIDPDAVVRLRARRTQTQPRPGTAGGDGLGARDRRGAVTRYTRDAAALLDVMSAPDRCAMYQALPPERPFADEVGRDGGRLRIGLLTTAPTGVPVADECTAAAEHTARLLESLGHIVEPAEPRFYSEDAFLGYAQTIVDAALWAAPYDQPELAEPHLRRRMERAAARRQSADRRPLG